MATLPVLTENPTENVQLKFSGRLDEGVAARAAIGLIVLASDQTVEYDFRRLLDFDDVGFFEARIPMNNVVTPDTLAEMEGHISRTTDLILPGVPLDVVAFGCTSASMVIGEDKIFERIHESRPEVKCTTPITGAFAAFEVLNLKRLAVLTPYRPDVNAQVQRYIESRGIQVNAMGSFNEEDDRRAARISEDSILEAAIALGDRDDIDGVFVSCTSLRLATAAARIEQTLGKPVTSSNHAMAWHCLRLAGVDDVAPQHGRLFEMQLPGG